MVTTMCNAVDGRITFKCALCTRQVEIAIDEKSVIRVDDKRAIRHVCVCKEKYIIHVNERTSLRQKCDRNISMQIGRRFIQVVLVDQSRGGSRCKMEKRFLKEAKINIDDVVYVGEDKMIVKGIFGGEIGLQHFDRRNYTQREREMIKNNRGGSA